MKWLPFLFLEYDPQLTFFQAGVDPLEHDRMGRMNISREGMQERNKMVLQAAKEHGCPCVVTMGGGYPKDLNPHSQPFQEVVEAHADVYFGAARAAASLSRDSV